MLNPLEQKKPFTIIEVREFERLTWAFIALNDDSDKFIPFLFLQWRRRRSQFADALKRKQVLPSDNSSSMSPTRSSATQPGGSTRSTPLLTRSCRLALKARLAFGKPLVMVRCVQRSTPRFLFNQVTCNSLSAHV